MSEKLLNMRSFGDALKSKMSKTAKKKFFDVDKATFDHRPEAEERDASKQEVLYELLFESLTYTLQQTEGIKIPDISKSWISGTVNNKVPLNSEIIKAAQRPEAVKEVADYFRENLIPNITKRLLRVAIDNVEGLVQSDVVALGKNTIESLKSKKKRNSEAEYLAEVWVLTVCMGSEAPNCSQRKSAKLKNEHVVDKATLKTLPKKPKTSVDCSGFFKSHVLAKEFINREVPRNVFYDILDSEPPFIQNVIMYYGIGGIGKSSLINNLKEYTKEQGVLFASVDFDDPALRSPYKALISLEKKIGTTFPHFDIAVTLCFIKRNPKLDSWSPNEMTQKAMELLQSSKGVFYDPTLGLTARIYDEFDDYFVLDETMQKPLAALEECSATDIEEKLPIFFAADLYRHMKNEGLDKCVLFFDTYEFLWEEGRGEENKLRNDAWIRTMAGIEMLDNVIFVLSGREKLQWELGSKTWLNKVQHVLLDMLTPEFAKQYLSICKIEDETIRNSIIKASSGHPYYLDLCVDIYYKFINSGITITQESFGGGFQEIQELFFRSLAENEIFVLRILSVPRFYDFEIFEALNNRFQTGYSIANFDNFNAFSFIKHEHNSKYIIHILMRDEIKKHIKRDLRDSIENCMINYYKEKLSPEKIPVDDIRYYFSELLYHLEAFESQEHVLARIEAEYIGIIKRLQISGETKYLLEQFLVLFKSKRSLLGGTEFFAVMTDMIHLSGKYKEAVGLITEYLSGFQTDEIAYDGYRLNLYIRRIHHQMFYVPLQVLHDDLGEIIDFVDQEKYVAQYCEMLFMLGAHIYLPMGNFEKAGHYLQQTNTIAKDTAYPGCFAEG